jgi:hypothetical protein
VSIEHGEVGPGYYEFWIEFNRYTRDAQSERTSG